MKKAVKLYLTPQLMIIAIVVIIGFSFLACNAAGADAVSTSGIEFSWIPAGSFTMGSNDINDYQAQPAHRVTLTKGFYMSKYLVTQEQWTKVMGNNPSHFSSNPAPGEIQKRRPVEMVNFYDAIVFCNMLSMQEGLSPAYSVSGTINPSEWGAVPTESNDAAWDAVMVVENSTGYRIPTEAQWEYACRAGTTTAYNTGNTMSDDMGWYDVNSGGITHEVGKKKENAWGLYDMHGNVWEWCWDLYLHYNFTGGGLIDPTGPIFTLPQFEGRRVDRCGSFMHDEQRLRSASRSSGFTYYRSHVLGFRIIRP
jgi:formylglycine-generating enzyme required for sulfatase activity